MTVNGWTFDPAREVWYAKTGRNTWTEVKGTMDAAPSFLPHEQPEPPLWVRMCGHHGCRITAPHAHGSRNA